MGNPYDGIENKRRIFQKLADVYPDGKSTSELENELELHRDTIRELCNDLKAESLVIKEGGRRGDYKLTLKAFGDPSIFSRRLASEALKKISYWNYSKNYGKGGFCNAHDCKCKRLHFYNPDDYKRAVSKILEEFVSRIGTLTVYQMIESLQFNKLRKIDFNSASKRKIKTSGAFVDKLTINYAKNAIEPSLILNEFLNFIDRERARLFNEDIMRQSEETDSNRSWSFFGIGEENYKMLREAFAIAYPDIFESLEGIKKQLPEIIFQLRKNKNPDNLFRTP